MNTQNPFKTSIFLLVFIFIAGAAKSQITSNFKLTSSAFVDGKPIPAKYTCADSNVSPALSWSGGPKNTKSFAIIMDDPDAPMGTWVHWVLYNIPDTVTTLKEDVNVAKLNATDGLNSWSAKGYNGPCPPDGTHRYVFKLYALDISLNVKEGMGKEELLEAMNGHILGVAVLTGLFSTE